MLQTGCFGIDISMIRGSQTNPVAFDQADQHSIRKELKTLSPQFKKEELNEAPAGKKHNLQILGKQNNHLANPNRRYQECSSLDRTLLE